MALVIAMVMILAMGTTAFAATITVENANENETYTAYKIFDAKIAKDSEGNNLKDDDGNVIISYTITSTNNVVWTTIIGTTDADDDGVYTKYGLTFTPSASDGTLFVVEATNAFSAASFAETLRVAIDANATALGIGTVIAEDGEETSHDLSTGYYFVDSTMGSLCSLATPEAEQSIFEKNTVPTITKKVKDETSDSFANVTDADLGENVTYQLTVNTGSKTYTAPEDNYEDQEGTGIINGSNDYVIVDKMATGITYVDNTISVKVGEIVWTLGSDYTVTYDNTKNTLTVTLLKTGKLKDLAVNTNIVIEYDGYVTASLPVYEGKNTNTVTLTYGNQESSDTASVYTWNFEIFKYTGEDTPLKDAEFSILDENGNAIELVLVGTNVYRRATKEDNNKVTVIKTDNTGTLTLKGFDAADYSVSEITAPDGYNKLDSDLDIIITGTVSGTGQDEMTKTLTGDGVNGNQVKVLNQAGSVLPSTGGIGTTIFYVIGAILVIGAGIVLVTRRRMNVQ